MKRILSLSFICCIALTSLGQDSEPPSVPDVYVTAPANGKLGTATNLTIAAKMVEGATSYTIEISPDQDFESEVISKTGKRTQMFTGLGMGVRYYTRVKTNLSQLYGMVTSFVTGPVVIGPKAESEGHKANITITSSKVTNATTYTFEVSTSTEFTNVITNGPGAPVQKIMGLAYNTVYYARVFTDLGGEGEFISFATAPAESFSKITKPMNGAGNVNFITNITASKVPYAIEYTIQLSESEGFTSTTEISSDKNTIAFTLEPGTTYYARARTNLSGEDQYGEYISFTTGTAQSLAYLASPKDGAIGVPNMFRATANMVPGATVYSIQIFNSPNTEQPPVSSYSGRRYYNLTLENGIYFARVSTNAAEGYGPLTAFIVGGGPAATRSSNDWMGDEEEEIVFEPVKAIVYPNPIGESFKMRAQTTVQGPMQAKIFDLQGKEILTHIGKTNHTESINTERMGKGVYVMKVVTNEGILTHKLMKE